MIINRGYPVVVFCGFKFPSIIRTKKIHPPNSKHLLNHKSFTCTPRPRVSLAHLDLFPQNSKLQKWDSPILLQPPFFGVMEFSLRPRPKEMASKIPMFFSIKRHPGPAPWQVQLSTKVQYQNLSSNHRPSFIIAAGFPMCFCWAGF